MDLKNEAIFREAMAALKIDVPVMATRVVGDRLELHLYGGRVVTWPVSATIDPSPKRKRKARSAGK